MRKLLIVLINVVFLFNFSTAFSKDSLKNYKTQDKDKKQLIELVLKFQNGYSKQNFKKILSVYTPDALIKTIVDIPIILGIIKFVDRKKLILYSVPLVFLYPLYPLIFLNSNTGQSPCCCEF